MLVLNCSLLPDNYCFSLLIDCIILGGLVFWLVPYLCGSFYISRLSLLFFPLVLIFEFSWFIFFSLNFVYWTFFYNSLSKSSAVAIVLIPSNETGWFFSIWVSTCFSSNTTFSFFFVALMKLGGMFHTNSEFKVS